MNIKHHMSFLQLYKKIDILYKYKNIYITLLPLMCMYSTGLGISAGMSANVTNTDKVPINYFSNMVGYTSIGIITGITYPISYPLFGCYILYKNCK